MGEELSLKGYIGEALLFHRSRDISTESYQQKIQVSLTWIKENSYYSSKDTTDYTKDKTKIEETTKD
jgi:hypothetical protein